jgi:hypothetical protein
MIDSHLVDVRNIDLRAAVQQRQGSPAKPQGSGFHPHAAAIRKRNPAHRRGGPDIAIESFYVKPAERAKIGALEGLFEPSAADVRIWGEPSQKGEQDHQCNRRGDQPPSLQPNGRGGHQKLCPMLT